LEKRQVKILNFCRQVWNFIKLTRVLFLLGGFLLYSLGAAAAVQLGVAINWGAYFLGQVVVISIQLMAQYLNEYYDIEVDRLAADNRTWFSGGSGILSIGSVTPSVVLVAARVCAVIATLTGILASIISPWMIPIFAISFLGSWFYSAPPLSLMMTGWGELTTSVIVALLVPLAGFCMQGGFSPCELWLVCVPLVLVHAAMLISFEFPDHDVDLSVGKKTLTVRVGLKSAAWVVSGLIGGAYLYLTILTVFSKYPGQWMVWAAPLAIWQMVFIHRVIHSPTRTPYYLLTTGGVGLFVLMTIMALMGFISVVK
jgi:1,4-dihydroxy-2-naphthoate polyprenyltransferase